MAARLVGLNRDILSVLYAAGSYWSRCGGSETRPGSTLDELVDLLAVQFPDETWDPEVVLLALNLGIKNGIYKTRQINFAGCCAQLETLYPPQMSIPYYANNGMVVERFTNKIYVDIAPRMICVPQLNRIIGPIV